VFPTAGKYQKSTRGRRKGRRREPVEEIRERERERK
jgi:hypothetical protein